jgi:hypothetical protein
MPEDHKSNFRIYTWESFSPRRNIAMLHQRNWQFPYQEDITTRAFSTWVVSGRKKLCKNAIGLEIISIIGERESRAVRNAGMAVKDIVSLVGGDPGLAFYEMAYYQIGGMLTLHKVSSLKRHRIALRDSSLYLGLFLELMRIYHFWAIELKNRSEYFPPSLHIAAPLVRATKNWNNAKKRPSTRLRDDLSPMMDRAALIYAASTILIDTRKTLLQAMQAHTLTHSQLRDVFNLWMRRATFVTEFILVNAAVVVGQTGRKDFNPYASNRRLLPKVESEAFDLDPPFKKEVEQELRLGFSISERANRRPKNSRLRRDAKRQEHVK